MESSLSFEKRTRSNFNVMMAEDNVSFNYQNFGIIAQNLAEEGKGAEAFTVFGIYMILFALIVTAIMHFIVKIFKRFGTNYSPFLPEVVKDIKIVAILITVLTLRSSIVLGIILGFVLWGIIQIYEYGCELQNQADETFR